MKKLILSGVVAIGLVSLLTGCTANNMNNTNNIEVPTNKIFESNNWQPINKSNAEELEKVVK